MTRISTDEEADLPRVKLSIRAHPCDPRSPRNCVDLLRHIDRDRMSPLADGRLDRLEKCRMNEQHASLFRLALSERLQLVEDLWDSIALDSPALPVTDWQKAELDRREALYRQNPALASEWEEAKQRILAKHGHP